MKNIWLTVLTFTLGVGLMYGCSENKQPAEKAKEASSQIAESAGEKTAVVKQAPAVAAETKEKAVEKKEAAPAPEVKVKPVDKKAPVLAAPVKEAVATVKEAVKGPVASVKEALKEPVAAVKDTAAGAAIFKSKCSLCHGAEGKGSTMAPAFKGNSWVKGASNADVADVIKNGRKGAAKKYKNFFVDMPANKGLAESDVNALVDYIKSIN